MPLTLLASSSTDSTGSEVSPVIWLAFTAFIVAMLALGVGMGFLVALTRRNLAIAHDPHVSRSA